MSEPPQPRLALLRYLGVGRLGKDELGNFKEKLHVLIAHNMVDIANETTAKQVKAHVKNIMAKGAAKLHPGKRIRLTSDDNDYDLHVQAEMLDEDPNRIIVFFAITDPDFSRSWSIANLLRDFKSGFYNLCDPTEIMTCKSGGVVHKKCQPFFNKLMHFYGSSKLRDVNQKVASVKDTLETAVRRATDAQHQLGDMEDKSELFQEKAKQFQKQATEVNVIQKRNYRKLTILVGVLLLGVIAYFVIPAAIKLNKSNNDSNGAVTTPTPTPTPSVPTPTPIPGNSTSSSSSTGMDMTPTTLAPTTTAPTTTAPTTAAPTTTAPTTAAPTTTAPTTAAPTTPTTAAPTTLAPTTPTTVAPGGNG